MTHVGPEVTVLMPVRNAAAWLSRAIRSLCRQTLGDFELLAVDDGSRDRPNRIWHVRDEQEVSVSTLLKNVSNFANRPLRLFRVPGSILRKSATLIGLGDNAQRLLAPFRVDMSDTLTQLDWRPSVSHANGIKEVVAWYLAQS